MYMMYIYDVTQNCTSETYCNFTHNSHPNKLKKKSKHAVLQFCFVFPHILMT